MPRDTTPRPIVGLVAGIAAVIVIAVPLGFVHDRLSRATPGLLLVLPVVLAALLGGRRPSIVVAVCAALAFNAIFIPPFLSLTIDSVEDVIAYIVYATVAVAIGTLVAQQADRRRAAEINAAEIARIHDALVEVTAERERLASEAQRVAVLEEIDRQRSALLRSVSHDLRTPLVTIRGVTSDLRSGADFDGRTRDELLDMVISEAERLDRIVSNLLSLSRIEAGALEPHLDIVDLGDLIANSVRRLQRVFAGSMLAVDVDPDLPLLSADPTLLDQVLTNLLENAVRHGGHHARISASTVPAGAEARCIQVTVADDGPGLPEIDRTQLFEPWHGQEHGSLSGVGLAICKSIVEAHGGSIAADDNPRGGARFTFTLPVSAPFERA
ncbi:MAG TPA: ATP-binding protein [Ilumatobacteraceae bacterium]|nr:ATP-binding protein [Ilumatobacteraceae bacterium]